MTQEIHMIGNAHLDPAWLWRWQEGYAEIKATFRSALDRMNEFPDFVFTCAGAAYYKWVEENSPEMFAEVKKRVDEGRWIIVGGWWIQPDCNIPCGESFVRQGLYSQLYFKEKFGVTAKVGYNVDSFGHNVMLPQILKQSGMDYYVFMRPQKFEKELKNNLFIWESPDGSQVTAFRIQEGYLTWFEGENDLIEEKNKKIFGIAKCEGVDYMSFYGVGNHGGGPTVRNLNSISRLKKEGSAIKLSSPNQYFEEAESKNYNLPVVREDLQHHASGCYSAHSLVKALNRKSEHRALTAEKTMCLAREIVGYDYEYSNMKKAWENIMFNQFHDILGGCSIKSVYQDAQESYGEALALSARSLNGALQKISWAIDTSKGQSDISLNKNSDDIVWEMDNNGVPIVVYNPLSFEVDYPVQLYKQFSRIEDDKYNVVDIQTVRAQRTNRHKKWDSMFIAKIPAYGYRVYWAYLKKESGLIADNSGLKIGDDYIENKWLRISFDKSTGNIIELYDKENKISMVKNGRAAVIDETELDTWGHGIFKFDDEIGAFGNAEIDIIEKGPIRCTLRIKTKYNNSILFQDFSLYRHKKSLEVKIKADFREQFKMVKLSFDTGMINSKAIYEIPYGVIEKPTDGLEECAQQWACVEGHFEDKSNDKYGLAVLNDSKYAYSIEKGEIKMTVLRGCIYADHFGERDELVDFIDQGIHEFSYEIVPYKGCWKQNGIVKLAMCLNVAPSVIMETYHKGHLPTVMEGIKISGENVIMTSMKISEDKDGYIFRCYETKGESCKTTIDIIFLNLAIDTSFSAHQIKTFKIPFDKSSISEVNFLEHGKNIDSIS